MTSSAWADLEREQRKMERSGAGRHDGGMRGADCLGQRGLELADLRPHRELAALDDLADGRELGLAHVRPGEPDRLAHGVETPSFSRYQAIVRSSPSSRSTLASNPSSVRAFSMFGIRSSTSM